MQSGGQSGEVDVGVGLEKGAFANTNHPHRVGGSDPPPEMATTIIPEIPLPR